MDHVVFAEILGDQQHRIEETLLVKAGEYALDDDRLSNFRNAAALTGQRMRDVCGGFMLKHTVSIYDMLGDDADFPFELWDEKITDHINYLILLRAIIMEEQSAQAHN